MKKRTARIVRKTRETDITLSVDLDGSGKSDIRTGIGFFDHLLDSLARHSLIDLSIQAKGDLYVDGHHTVEDVGICLGAACGQALADKQGISRFGFAYCPLDEALSRAVVDVSGRGFFIFEPRMPLHRVGEFDGELLIEFLRAFAVHSQMTVHVGILYGANQHHMMESLMKSLARALRMALTVDPREPGIPSTKGVLA
ncbi:MAG TPA: imidazoleglycerol-phosphate dehydratase HisB [bacterium]|nr:imidazoleglycerol-phosphate dehydratase HisB [bacterium]